MIKHLYDMDGVDTIAADTWQQALDTWCGFTSEPESDYRDSLVLIPDDKLVAIRWELETLKDFVNQIPTEAEFEFRLELGGYQVLATALARRWAEVTLEPSIICSTEW